jgi:uncharacterized membrane protein
LTDDELLHYAGLDPDVAAELTRRISAGGVDPSAEREELRDELRHAEDAASDAEDEAENLREDAREACRWIRLALDPADHELTQKQLLQKALDCLE